MGDIVTKSIIVKGEAADLYNRWLDVESFPHFMENVRSVRKTDETTSEWVVDGPFGKALQWEAHITRDEPNKRIAWKSSSGDIKTSGQVTFTKLPNEETQITLTFHYVPAGGAGGQIVARFFGHVDEKLQADLGNFKKFAEGMYDRLPRV